MSSRQQILKSIRRNLPVSVDLPDHAGSWVQYPDLIAQFGQVLEGVGGQLQVVNSVAEIIPFLPELSDPSKVVSSGIPGITGNFDIESIADPHALAPLDLAIYPGELAVAENAGVWVNAVSLRHRVVYFISQHCALVVQEKNLVANLHEAYERIDIQKSHFGCFISGPSKTADIEQSLVKGAHGARTLMVFLVRENHTNPQ